MTIDLSTPCPCRPRPSLHLRRAGGEFGDDVVMIGRCAWRRRATGAPVDSPKVDIRHFEFGKVTRFTELFDSLAFARAVGAA